MLTHKRSPKAELRREQRYQAKRYVFETSWKDRVITEIIEKATPELIDQHVALTLSVDEPQVYFSINDWHDGLVLVSALTYAIYQNMQLLPAHPVWSLEDEDEVSISTQ
jgi:hypothetical protein